MTNQLTPQLKKIFWRTMLIAGILLFAYFAATGSHISSGLSIVAGYLSLKQAIKYEDYS